MERIAYRNHGRFCDAENSLTLQKRIYVLKKLIGKKVKALYVDVIRFIERLKVALGIKAKATDTRKVIDRLAGATRKDGNGLYVKTVDIVALFDALSKTLLTAGVVIGGSAAGYMAYKHQGKARELAEKASGIAKPGAEVAGKVIGSAVANAGIGAVKGMFNTINERLEASNKKSTEQFLNKVEAKWAKNAEDRKSNDPLVRRAAQREFLAAENYKANLFRKEFDKRMKAEAEARRKLEAADRRARAIEANKRNSNERYTAQQAAKNALITIERERAKRRPSMSLEEARDRYDYMW